MRPPEEHNLGKLDYRQQCFPKPKRPVREHRGREMTKD